MAHNSSKVICIQGPTASGKSSLAEALAQRLSGEIISADSMQIYQHMDIGTAKTPVDQRSVPYHCIDICTPGQAYSAALFQKDARKAIEAIYERGNTPILCGGTGLYVRATLDDMDFAAGEYESPIRKKYEQLADELGADGLHHLLSEKDPKSAALIHPNNVRRVIRALEMYEEGESYAQRKEAFSKVSEYISSIKIALDVDRDILYERINKRVDIMLEQGLISEVTSLLNQGFREALTSSQAIGYKEIVAYLDNQMSLQEAVDLIKQSTRRYAKRQLSWLRGDNDIVWLNATDGVTDTLIENALTVIERAH